VCISKVSEFVNKIVKLNLGFKALINYPIVALIFSLKFGFPIFCL
jgi:hypothetical protein